MDDSLHEITAKKIKIEVTDERTGQVYTRDLPVDYYENANCLRLQAENMDGNLSELIFYTARGIDRIKDLTGKGSNHDGCDSH